MQDDFWKNSGLSRLKSILWAMWHVFDFDEIFKINNIYLFFSKWKNLNNDNLYHAVIKKIIVETSFFVTAYIFQ